MKITVLFGVLALVWILAFGWRASPEISAQAQLYRQFEVYKQRHERNFEEWPMWLSGTRSPVLRYEIPFSHQNWGMGFVYVDTGTKEVRLNSCPEPGVYRDDEQAARILRSLLEEGQKARFGTRSSFEEACWNN